MTLHVTENPQEMIAAGKALFAEHAKLYDARMTSIIYDTIEKSTHGLTVQEKEDLFYKSIYHYWVYGNNIAEYFYYGFDYKTHEEKKSYITFRERYAYIHHLSDMEDARILVNKYQAYERLKPFYKRDVIEIFTQADFGMFLDFIEKHPVFVAKPSSLALAIGVQKVDSRDFSDKQKLFDRLLTSGVDSKNENPWGGVPSVVCEELIDQHEGLKQIHPASVNGIRVNAIRVNDKIEIFGPWFKIGVGGHFVTGGAQGSLLAGINAQTGIVETLAYDELGRKFDKHPQTGYTFVGYQIPQWESLLQTVRELSEQLPTVGYVGWDMVLTQNNGWCVMEGNQYGEFIWQLVYDRGMKDEFEQLIQWKPTHEFWWQK